MTLRRSKHPQTWYLCSRALQLQTHRVRREATDDISFRYKAIKRVPGSNRMSVFWGYRKWRKWENEFPMGSSGGETTPLFHAARKLLWRSERWHISVPVADSRYRTDCAPPPLCDSDSRARALHDHRGAGLHGTVTNISQLPRKPRAEGKMQKWVFT